MTKGKLRLGIIGANANYGWAPRAHLPALKAVPNLDLVAVCTSHKETAQESAKKFGVPLAFDDPNKMLNEAELDVIGVVVRVPFHYQLTTDAIASGKHVFTEWPLGANLVEAETMADLARQNGVHTMVGLQARCSPAFLRLKELIGDGYLGEILSCHMTQFLGGGLARTSDRTWQRDKQLGANTLTIAFGHAIDALCMCLGEFQELSAVVSTQVSQWYESDTGRTVDVTAPDSVQVAGRLRNGAAVSAHVSSVPWHGSGFRLEVYGRAGTIVLTTREQAQIGKVRLLGARGTGVALEEMPIPERLTWISGSVLDGASFNVAQMWSRFANNILSGEKSEPDFHMAVVRHKLLDTIQHASDTGKKQVV